MPRVKTLPRSRRQYVTNSAAIALARELKGARGAPMPHFIAPSLASPRHRPPSAEGWLHEIKFDGYRAQLHRSDAGAKVFTRRGYDWSERFRNIASASAALGVHQVVLDGEVIVPTPEGRSDYAALESDLAKGGSDRLIFYAFDILYLELFDLRGCRLIDRKRVLRELLDGVKGPLKLSDHIQADSGSVYEEACRLELEGIVSKRLDSPYRSGRTDSWIKSTCRQRDTFVVAGWARNRGKFEGVYLGRREGGKLVYAGKLERGFGEDDKKRILELFARLKSKTAPFKEPRAFPKAQWMKPRILLDAEFRGKTGDGLLRHASFKGLRRDLME